MINTLFDYFKSKGQALPSVQQRASTYGLKDYTGTADQNNALLARLQGGQANGQQMVPTVPNTVNGQTPPPVSNPAPQATVPTPAPQEDYLKKYLDSLNPTADENNVQSQLSQAQADSNQFDLATQQGVARLEGRGLGVPLQLVRGQQAQLEKQAGFQKQGQLLNQQTLQQKLANLQSRRKSAIDVSKFALERADTAAKTVSDRAYEEQKLAKAAAEKDNAPYTLSQGQTRYDAKGNVLSAVAPKATTKSSPVKPYISVTPTQKSKLSGLGLSVKDLKAFEEDANNSSVEDAIAGLPTNLQANARKILGSKGSSKAQGTTGSITEESIKGMFAIPQNTAGMLKALGKDRSEYAKFFQSASTEEKAIKADYDNYITSLIPSIMARIKTYQEAGMSDDEILKLLK